MYCKFLEKKLRIVLVLLPYGLKVILLCKCEFWCVKISLACFKDSWTWRDNSKQYIYKGNNTWLLTVLMKNGIEIF